MIINIGGFEHREKKIFQQRLSICPAMAYGGGGESDMELGIRPVSALNLLATDVIPMRERWLQMDSEQVDK